MSADHETCFCCREGCQSGCRCHPEEHPPAQVVEEPTACVLNPRCVPDPKRKPADEDEAAARELIEELGADAQGWEEEELPLVRRFIAAAREQGRQAGLEEAAKIIESMPNIGLARKLDLVAAIVRCRKSEPSR